MVRPGRSIRCSRCNASIELNAVALTAPCTSCGHVEPVPPELVEELRRYEGQYAASIEDANASLRKAQSMEDMASQIPASNTTFKIFGAVIGTVVIVSTGLQFMLMSRTCSSDAKSNAMMLFPMIVMVLWLGIPIYFFRRRSQTKASRVSAAAIHVACPTCGANNELVAGNSAAACSYCGGRLMPSPTVVMQVLDAGAIAQAQAGMSAMRAKRTVTLRQQNAGVDPIKMASGFFGILILLSLGGALVSSVFEGNIRAVLLLSLLMSLMALPVSLFLLWRSRRRERWTSPLIDLAQQFGGRYSTKLADQVAWLNSYWANTYSEYWIVGAGLRFGTLAAEVAGYPLLLDVHPEKPYGSGRHAKPYRPRLNILVASRIPLQAQSLSRLPAEARVHVDVLNKMGFDLILSTSGILAKGRNDLLRRFTRQPEDLHLLAQTFQSLTSLAAYLGQPAAPLP